MTRDGKIAVGVGAVAIVIAIGFSIFLKTPKVEAQPAPVVEKTLGPTDMVVGTTYRVADFLTCRAPNGALRYEVHFGGADRSRRAQQIPYFDGRGRRILRVSKAVPTGHLRLTKVTEHRADPTLEGFTFGSFIEHWEGLVVEINGRVKPQRRVGPCGPARR